MIVVVFILFIIVFFVRIPKFESNSTIIPVQSVTVLIAVRNESMNLKKLFDSFENQNNIVKLGIQIILIDDGSEDDSFVLLQEWANQSQYDVQIVDLHEANGKKSALRKGAMLAKYDYLLFTDADCQPAVDWISTAYFQFITQDSDLLIGSVWYNYLPSLFNRLQRMEFAILQAVTAITTTSGFPFMCNGANLMTKRELYLDYLKQEKTSHYASGDDVFYMDYLIQQKKKIRYCFSINSTVLTNGIDSLSAFLHQRLRWSSKVKYYRNPKMVIPSLIFSVWSFLFPILLLVLPWISLFDFYSLLFTKLVLDYILFFWFFKGNKTSFLFLDFIFLEIIHPFYVFAIGILSIFKSFNWKNREAKA